MAKLNKRTKNLIILGAVLVILAVLLIVVSTRPEEVVEEQPKVDESVQLYEASSDDVIKLTITTPDGEKTSYIEETYEETVKNAEGEDEEVSKERWTVESGEIDYVLKESKITSAISSLIRLKAERVIEEQAPSDLSIYGLDKPYTVAATLVDGTVLTAYCGDKTPAGSTYYMMVEGEDKIYECFSNYGNSFRISLNDVRDKTIYTDIDYTGFKHIIIDRADSELIEVAEKKEVNEELAGYGMGMHYLKEPFERKPDLKGNAYETFSTELPMQLIGESIVEDKPQDLSKYGLDEPYIMFYVADQEQQVRVLIGDEVAGEDGCRYAKLPNGDTVYTINRSDIKYLETVQPFDLAERFVLLVNIADLKRVELEGLGETHSMEIQRETTDKDEDEDGEKDVIENYFIDDQPMNEDLFKDIYQVVIGLIVDDVSENEELTEDNAEVTMTYELDSGEKYIVYFVPYNDYFYEVHMNEISEFIISKDDIADIFKEFKEIS